ncbi:MAG TPA: protease modulator HflC [Gammaproteobacteria bacterium]|jgi:membrane protease subunit HflC|nr:protease modulator HflC [Gammaproteobacteria bacterium]
MGAFRSFVVALLAVLAVAIYLSTYTIDQTQVGLKFRFGRIVETDIPPGLHFKVPIMHTVRRFDARVHTLDEEPSRFLTSEKKNVIVDAFVKWRIRDATRFYTTVGGDPTRANQRLSEIIRSGLRTEFGKRTIQEVISGERSRIMTVLTEHTIQASESLGIDVVDVKIQRIDLPGDVSESVYRRMAAERERVARDFRARGAEAAERIRADVDRQRTVILAEAYRDAEQIRGQGDARSAEVYAQAYQRDAEFYSFYRSLAAYRKSFNSPDDVLLLSPDSTFFRYWQQLQPAR